mmetsp:Transcript_25126/g.62864  ORF Transcript_25126/g.62864 Transcript_25126/m.62864 type:complete len:84 (+) Transcript_25126:188-439(+)
MENSTTERPLKRRATTRVEDQRPIHSTENITVLRFLQPRDLPHAALTCGVIRDRITTTFLLSAMQYGGGYETTMMCRYEMLMH